MLDAHAFPLVLRGGQKRRIDRAFALFLEEAETAIRDAALRTPTLVTPRVVVDIVIIVIIIVLKMERFRERFRNGNDERPQRHALQKKDQRQKKMGPYSGSSLARFVRVGAVATGITYGFVVSGAWSLVRL